MGWIKAGSTLVIWTKYKATVLFQKNIIFPLNTGPYIPLYGPVQWHNFIILDRHRGEAPCGLINVS